MLREGIRLQGTRRKIIRTRHSKQRTDCKDIFWDQFVLSDTRNIRELLRKKPLMQTKP